MLSQSYYCSKCGNFVITYTSRFNDSYQGIFLGCSVKKTDSYCPYCGEKNTSCEMPPMDEVMRILAPADEETDEERDERDESEWIEEEDAGDYDHHDWILPETDKSVRAFTCSTCGVHFKIGYYDGRKRKAFCPLCGGKATRVVE